MAPTLFSLHVAADVDVLLFFFLHCWLNKLLKLKWYLHSFVNARQSEPHVSEMVVATTVLTAQGCNAGCFVLHFATKIERPAYIVCSAWLWVWSFGSGFSCTRAMHCTNCFCLFHFHYWNAHSCRGLQLTNIKAFSKNVQSFLAVSTSFFWLLRLR